MQPIMECVLDIIVARGNVTKDEAVQYMTTGGVPDDIGYDQTLYENHIAPGINEIEDAIIAAREFN